MWQTLLLLIISNLWYTGKSTMLGFFAILREIKSFTFSQQCANRPLWVTTSTLSLKWHTEVT